MPTREEYWKYAHHYKSDAERERKRLIKHKNIAEGKCRCGKPLLEGASTKKHCVVCIESGSERRQLSRWNKIGGE